MQKLYGVDFYQTGRNRPEPITSPRKVLNDLGSSTVGLSESLLY